VLHTKKAESCANSVILRAVTAAASSWLLIDAIPANMMGYLMPSSWVSGVLSVDIALHLVGPVQKLALRLRDIFYYYITYHMNCP